MSNEVPILHSWAAGTEWLAISPIGPNLAFLDLSHGSDGGIPVAISGSVWIAIGFRAKETTGQTNKLTPCSQALKDFCRTLYN